jgi:hypothetical protein
MPGEKLAAETAALPLFRQLENLFRLAIFWMRFAQLICAIRGSQNLRCARFGCHIKFSFFTPPNSAD